LRKRGLWFIGEDGGDMLQPVDLGVQLTIYFLVAVPDADGDDAAEKIQVLIAVGIPDILVLGVRDDQRFFVVMKDGREKMVPVGEKDFFFGHV